MEANHWLISEHLGNWKIDEQNGFKSFGVTRRFGHLSSKIAAGDFLYTYVLGKRAFSDLRQVTKAGLSRLALGGAYDVNCPFFIETAPLLVLPPERWVPVESVRQSLEATRDREHWLQVFRHAPRQLAEADGRLLATRMRESAPV
jgi:hypothetical protein